MQKTNDYHRSISVKTSPQEALKNISEVPKWWGRDFTGQAANLNDEFTIRFGKTFVDFRISEVIPNKKVVWQVTGSHIPSLKDKSEWTGTHVDWEVSATQDGTEILMTHVGLGPEVECYEMCEKGWDFFVGKSLFKLITEHAGLPDQPHAER